MLSFLATSIFFRLIVPVCLVLYQSSFLQAQENVELEQTHSIYASFGGFESSLSYEHLLKPGKVSAFYAHLSVGQILSSDDSDKVADVSLHWLIGRKNSKLELAGGLGLDISNFLAYPNIDLGYRFQKPNRGFIYRAGIGFPEAVYLSIGYAF